MNMCQKAEGESDYLQHMEDVFKIRGFASARFGKPKDCNPGKNDSHSINMGYMQAWQDGWEAYHERSLPWPLDREYRRITGAWQTQDIQKRFKENGELTKELEDILAGYTY